MVDRRAFVRNTVGAWLSCAVIGLRSREARISMLVDDERSATKMGLEFGASEARRSAALFGWRITVAPDDPRPHALILGNARPAPISGIPILRVVHSAGTPADGTFCVAPAPPAIAWRETLERYGAQQLNDRYRAATGSAMNADAWTAWFAVKVIADAILRLDSTDPQRLAAYLRAPDTHFDGHKGAPLRFDVTGELVQPVYT